MYKKCFFLSNKKEKLSLLNYQRKFFAYRELKGENGKLITECKEKFTKILEDLCRLEKPMKQKTSTGTSLPRFFVLRERRLEANTAADLDDRIDVHVVQEVSDFANGITDVFVQLQQRRGRIIVR